MYSLSLLPNNCRWCHRFVWWGAPLCGSCFNLIKSFESRKTEELNRGALQVQSMVDWVPGQSQVLSTLIHQLKGADNQAQWNFLVRQFGHRISPALQSCEIEGRPLVLVPIPSRQGRRHAQELAQSIGAVYRIPVGEVLVPTKDDKLEQKRKGRSLRRQIQVDLDQVRWRLFMKTHTPILVDDIVTTGATAQAAMRALALDKISLICFANRTRLAGPALI